MRKRQARKRLDAGAEAGLSLPKHMARQLDTPYPRLYRARPLAGAVLALWATVAQAEVVNGVQLPEGAEKVGENRYRVKEDFDGTKKFYKSILPSKEYPRHGIIDQPGIKAIHIENPNGGKWQGLNIYQADDETRLFIIPAEEAPKPARRKVESKAGRSKNR